MTAPTPTPAATPLCLHLRAATRQAHRRLDHHPLTAGLVRGPLTHRGYGAILGALHALHAPLEAAFAAFHPDAPPPPRAADLAADLQSLRLGHLAGRLPWAGKAPASAAEYVGMRYIIEGSARGGRVIAAGLPRRLPAECRAATRFFDAQCDDAPWAAFWSVADRLGPVDAEEAAAAARRLFAEIMALWDLHHTAAADGAVLPCAR